jgi:hypothetical protein
MYQCNFLMSWLRVGGLKEQPCVVGEVVVCVCTIVVQ